ncbi:MAG: tRNA 2-thiocytidine biosynthesis TtcA family protein [Spirochaetales bacterium]|jgi:tRNA 2-thiocytidine biosynthesis protein TtcA|nr:tRNA 2-thiocytidine biosynthesis TtcA family protein [Spirochaetales bacterium]
MRKETTEQTEKIPYQHLIKGDFPPWVHRFIKKTGKGVNDFSMIADGDKVLLGISGGKDSLALAVALSLRRKWLPISYSLEALHINWIEHPIPEKKIEQLHRFFDDLDIPLTSQNAHMFHSQYQDDFNCYICSRNRRRILFDHAAAKGIRLIALGHHLDDLVETSMINLCFRADFSTMHPVQEIFKRSIYVIRPMIQVREQVTSRLAQQYDLPVVKPVCPYDQTNIRSRVKPIIRELSRIDKLTREHMYKAHEFSCRIPRYETPHHTGLREPDLQEKA